MMKKIDKLLKIYNNKELQVLSIEQEESCFKAISIRRGQDTTRTLHYCNYGAKK